MDLVELQRNWDRFGNEDPLWAILTDPSKKGNKWDVDDFFKSGVEEIKGVMEYLEHLHLDVSRERALDFGCGVGRLTQALADYFKAVAGVDIAPSMIDHAIRFNRFGERCKYVVNQTDDLSIFKDETFSFIYSNIVLQHMEPKYALSLQRLTYCTARRKSLVKMMSQLTKHMRSCRANCCAFVKRSLTSGVPCSFLAISGICRTRSSLVASAVPASSPKTKISASGCKRSQLAMALR